MGIGDPDAFDKLLYLNLSSPIRLTRVLAPAMAEKGGDANIINISSVAGRPHRFLFFESGHWLAMECFFFESGHWLAMECI